MTAPSRPRLAIDHVQVALPDLAEAARRWEDEHGLTSLPGGSHPGRGTGNRIVPLGGAYLELIAVVDRAQAEAVPTSMRVARAVESGRRFAVWVARTGALDESCAALSSAGWELPPVASGFRLKPDGSRLAWRMQELVPKAAFSPLPFLIEWEGAPDRHPGAEPVEHPSGARSIAALVLADPDPKIAGERLRGLVGDDLEWSVVRGEPGVREVVLAAPGGRHVLR